MDKQAELKKLEAQAENLRKEIAIEQSLKRNEGIEKLNVLTENILAQIKRGEELAEEYGIYWSLSDKLPYGMGGSYQPASLNKRDGYYRQDGWQSSSHSC